MTARRLPRRPEWIELASLGAVFAVLAAATWGAWPDVLVDFGRELYVAWRIASGDVLYRDVASFYGPLSPYVNGALFRVAGVGLRTLAVANLAILAGATLLLRVLLRRAGTGRAASAAACAAFLALFGFAHLVSNGSFNFVCPYAHEATHGFVLALAALQCALRAADARAARPALWAAAAGGACGLAFLTKPEPFVAALGASAFALLLAPRPGRPRAALTFSAGLVLPPLAAFLLLAAAMPAEDAWRGTLGSWAFLGNPDLWSIGYFGWSAGLDHPGAQTVAMARAAAVEAAVLVPAAALAFVAGGRPRAARWAALGCAIALAAALVPLWRSRSWLDAARPLPLWAAGLAAAATAAFRRSPDAERQQVLLARAGLAVLAALLLPRIVLNARFFHYGFALAAPAAIAVAAALLDWIPRALDAAGAAGVVMRAVGITAVAFACASSIRDSQAFIAAKSTPVGTGADAFRADARGAYVNAVVANLPRAAPGGTLVMLPEGVMVNYLLRRPSSIPYLTMLPSDEAQFGEDEMLGSLRRRPPDLIGLVHRTAEEFGLPLFGRDYAKPTMEWISAHYTPVFTVGDPPLEPGSRFGVRILVRRSATAGP